MSLSPAKFFQFRRDTDDHGTYVTACNGAVHATHVCPPHDPENERITTVEPCDGDCNPDHPKRQIDLRAWLSNARVGKADFQYDIPGTYPVKLDRAFRFLLRSDRPMVGVLFRTFYGKRFRASTTVCLDGRHIKLEAELDSRGAAIRHAVRSYACDGSCQPRPYAIPTHLLLPHEEAEDDLIDDSNGPGDDPTATEVTM